MADADEEVLARLLEAGLADMAVEALLAGGAAGPNLEQQGLRELVCYCCGAGQTMGKHEAPPPPLDEMVLWWRQALPGAVGFLALRELH